MVDIVFTGGGTAGHVTPNLALIPELQAKSYQLAYIGQSNSIEQTLVEEQNIPFYIISAGKLRRYIDFQNITDLFKILLGLFQALKHLQKLKPKVVFSKGGFVSTPVVWAAWLLRIPVIIHESDISPGLANKLSLPFARKIAYSFPETKKYLPEHKSILTGVAIRDSLKNGSAENGKTLCNFQSPERAQKPCIVIIGGSQGSKAINQLVRNALPNLIPEYNVCHLCGKEAIDKSLTSLEGYSQFEYMNEELSDIFAMADLVISRAGATSIFELLSLQKNNLLIPLPLSASRGDQILNADSFMKQGFSKVVTESDLHNDPKLLMILIKTSLVESHIMQKRMAEFSIDNAKFKIITLIEEQLPLN